MMNSGIQLVTVVRKFGPQFIIASAIGFLVVCLVAVANCQPPAHGEAAKQPAANLPNQWIAIASRETKDEPTLVVTPENGEAKTYTAAADTVLISYLAD